jgi:hypothetical protein
VTDKNEPLMIGKFIVGKFQATDPVFITNYFLKGKRRERVLLAKSSKEHISQLEKRWQ